MIVATWCSVLQRVAVCRSTLQCVAVCCSVLQCGTMCCNALRDGPTRKTHLSLDPHIPCVKGLAACVQGVAVCKESLTFLCTRHDSKMIHLASNVCIHISQVMW